MGKPGGVGYRGLLFWIAWCWKVTQKVMIKCIYTKKVSNEISAKPSQAKIVHVEGRVNKLKFIRNYRKPIICFSSIIHFFKKIVLFKT